MKKEMLELHMRITSPVHLSPHRTLQELVRAVLLLHHCHLQDQQEHPSHTQVPQLLLPLPYPVLLHAILIHHRILHAIHASSLLALAAVGQENISVG